MLKVLISFLQKTILKQILLLWLFRANPEGKNEVVRWRIYQAKK